jgi:hypothetical protein
LRVLRSGSMSQSRSILSRWRRSDWVELGAVLLLPLAGGWVVPLLPGALALGELMLGLAVIVLLQTLVRDLWRLRAARRAPATPATRARCMCMESVIGLAGIVCGALVLAAGVLPRVEVEPLMLSLALLLALGVGFGVKDFVIEAAPWRIRRAPDHVHLLVTWRS